MEKMQHFSIRKLSIGAASVLIGISFLGVKASTVKADALQNASKAELAQSKAANEAIEQDTGSNIEQEPTSDIKQDTSSNIEQEPVSKVDAKQITNDQPNAVQAPAKLAAPKPNSNQQNAADRKAEPQVPAKIKLQTNSVITPNKVGQSKVKATALLTTAGKKFNAQMLFESKVVSPTKDTNGGFDEATWGKLNVNDWTIKTLTDADVKDTLAKSGNLELTAYNGDEQHVIIPNLLDIYNAGKADSAMVGNLANEDSTRVVISKDLLSQFSRTATSIAFSKTHTDHISNKDVTQMSDLTKTGIDHLTKVYSKDSDLSNAFSHFNKYSNWSPSDIYAVEAPRVKLDATNFDVSNVTNMTETFAGSNYDGLSTIADWNTANATTMNGMFINANLSDLRFLSRWNTANVTDMSRMFMNNPLLTNLVPIADWNTGNVTTMDRMFIFSPISYADLSKWDFSKIAQYVESDGGAPGLDSFLVNYNDPSAYNNKTVYLGDNKTIPSWVLDMSNGLPNYCIFRANENTGNYVIITSDPRLLANSNGAYNHLTFTDNTGKQTKVDIPMAISTENATGDFDSVKQRVLDFVNAEVAKQAAPTGKKWVMTDTDLNDPVKIANANFKLIDISLPVLNTNDAYALDSKNGLHEHANVNDNGGYDKDYWGAIDLNNWNYTQDNTGDITLSGYKGSDNTKIIIPNIADFSHGNVTQVITLQVNPNVDTNKVYISSSVMHDLAKNATRIGLSKTANKKVIAKDGIWQDAFGGMTNKPGTTDNAYGGIKYSSPNLTQMDLHNLDTVTITDMSALFNGGNNLTTVGDLSDWNTSNVNNMHVMFQAASSLINIGNLDNWDTRRVTDMSYMFRNVYNLTNIGDLSKWQTGNVTDMHNMFSNAINLTNIGNLDDWNTSKVTDMHGMFDNTTSLINIGDLSKWQTGNVTNMNNMFANATNLTNIGNLDNWDTSKVTDMNWMFGTDSGKQSHLINIGDLSKWQTGNVTDMHNMFANATNLTNIGNLDNWDTSKVTDMNWMFGTDSGKQSHLINIGDLSKWQTGNVTDMHNMFANATNLTNIGNLYNWDTNKVTNMHWMFGGATNLTNIGDLSKWQTGNVTDMHNMFANATNLTNIGNLYNWDTNKVTDMSYMFISTEALRHLNISNWNLTKLANKNAMKYMFANDVNSTVIANDLKLPTWYENEINDADYFWNNHIAVITNVPELIKATGDINNLKIDNQDASRSIFYDSKGSSDAIKVLTDANNQYIADYHKANPTKVLKLADTVDQNDPIALANASFVTLPYKLADSNTNDAFALDSKHGLHEHINVNDNGGYDADFWGKINVDDWNYTVRYDTIEINGLKDGTSIGANDAVIVPNLDDFKLAGKDGGAKTIYISPSVLINTARHKYYGLSKTNGNTFTTDSNLNNEFAFDSHLTHADLNSLNTGNVTDMISTFYGASSLTSLDVSNWDTSSVTNMNYMFYGASSLTSLDVSNWDTSNVADMSYMFAGASSLALIANSGKFADYLVNHDNFAESHVDSDVKSVTTDNAKLLKLLTNDAQHDSATRTIVFTFPTNYSPDLAKYHLTKIGNTYQIKQSADYDKSYVQGTVLINGTDDITEHHIDTTKKNKLSDTWQPNYDKLVLAHKNADGSVSFDDIQLPQIPGYKTVASLVNPARALFAVSFMALPKPVTPAINDVKPAETVTPVKPAITDAAEPIKTELKVATTPKTIDLSDDAVVTTPKTIDLSDDAVVTTPKAIDLSNDAVATTPKVIDLSDEDDAVTVTPKETTWQVANDLKHDTYHVSNGKYAVELPHISNTQLHVIANDSTKDNVLFTYKGQNSKYVFNIKFANGHYLLTTYKVKSGKLVKLIDYNFVKASKMIHVILDWINLK